MKKYLFLAVSILLWWLNSPLYAQENTETRKLPAFQKIKVGGSVDVVLRKGEEESAKIIVTNVDIQDVITEVVNGMLYIKQKDKLNFMFNNGNNRKKIEVALTYRQLEEVHVSGAGSVSAINTLQSENLLLHVSGAGDIILPIEARKLDVHISGAGDVKVQGKADTQYVKVSGAGDYKAYDLTTLRTEARVSGAGDVNVYASEGLSAHVSGSGDIRYKGNPKNKDIATSGAGSVRRTD